MERKGRKRKQATYIERYRYGTRVREKGAKGRIREEKERENTKKEKKGKGRSEKRVHQPCAPANFLSTFLCFFLSHSPVVSACKNLTIKAKGKNDHALRWVWIKSLYLLPSAFHSSFPRPSFSVLFTPFSFPSFSLSFSLSRSCTLSLCIYLLRYPIHQSYVFSHRS